MRVEQVLPGRTLALRQQVLRPHQTVAELAALPVVSGTIAFAAFDDCAVVGTALVLPEPLPEKPGRSGAWRLRGMATAPERRGQGIGAMVIAEVITQLREQGAELLWCNARTPARAFYERAGFAVIGEPWVDPAIGPHVRMWRHLQLRVRWPGRGRGRR